MRRFFSTIMLYAVILIGFSWVYHNNDNARAAVNRIAYVAQANFQQLKSRVTGQKATTTASAKTQQTSSDSDSVSGRWKKTTATVYVSYENQTLQQAALDAIAKWNATGSFKFTQTSSRKNADIVMTTMSKDNDAAGMTQMSVDSLTGYFVHGTVYLNTAYLLDPSYGYTMERIVNTAEHELGCSIPMTSQSCSQPDRSIPSSSVTLMPSTSFTAARPTPAAQPAPASKLQLKTSLLIKKSLRLINQS